MPAADYVVQAVAVEIDGATFQRGDTITVDLPRRHRWLLNLGHIAPAPEPPADAEAEAAAEGDAETAD